MCSGFGNDLDKDVKEMEILNLNAYGNVFL